MKVEFDLVTHRGSSDKHPDEWTDEEVAQLYFNLAKLTDVEPTGYRVLRRRTPVSLFDAFLAMGVMVRVDPETVKE